MKRKKRHITLIEIMIVITIIAMITGVLAYNYTGSLEETKASKTKIGMEKVATILNLERAENPGRDIIATWVEVIKNSPLVQDANALVRDGWGNLYTVELDENQQIQVSSEKYNSYKKL